MSSVERTAAQSYPEHDCYLWNRQHYHITSQASHKHGHENAVDAAKQMHELFPSADYTAENEGSTITDEPRT